MVTVNLIGGLGNNLFQIAATIGYAEQHGLQFYFPPQKYFKNLPTKENSEDIVYKEKSFSYDEIPYYPSVCLSGYFQSEKYFSHCRKKILKVVGFSKQKVIKISIHVRRGDYLQTECHPVVTLDYLNSAINYFKLKGFKDKDFLIFTDDKVWCKENFPTFEIAKGNELEDLESMSRCVHNIISNSSYSWWAAWVNDNKFKEVIAPKIWFSGSKSDIDLKDLLPIKWIKL